MYNVPQPLVTITIRYSLRPEIDFKASSGVKRRKAALEDILAHLKRNRPTLNGVNSAMLTVNQIKCSISKLNVKIASL